jgi:Mg/Co/Ni transporter MgtE
MDPALAIGPFITTMNDLVGVWIYLTIPFQVGDWL